MSKFKVGDLVKGIHPERYSVTNTEMTKGIVTEIFKNNLMKVKVLEHKNKKLQNWEPTVEDRYFELLKEKTEFTFQEVIARIQPGEIYECTRMGARVQKISLDDKWFFFETGHAGNYAIPTDDRFKLVEPKKNYLLVRVEHTPEGKQYDFIPGSELTKDDFVVCDTIKGEVYGKVISWHEKVLTEAEYKKYKKCWRAK